MANEPIITNKPENGRPSVAEEQFQQWLESMRPFLENSNSLYYALVQAGLLNHQTVIYEKYRKKDWFAQKVDAFRRTPGELVNDAIVSIVRHVGDKVKRKESITKDEQDILKFYAEKSRSAQPFFVNRTETAPAEPIDDLLEELDKEDEKSDTIDDVAEEASKQVVALDAPIQNQEQTGATSPVQTEPNAVASQG